MNHLSVASVFTQDSLRVSGYNTKSHVLVLRFYLFIFNYVYERISGEAIAYECSAKEVRRRHRVPWKLALWVVVICLTWVLGTKLGSSVKAAGFLNC